MVLVILLMGNKTVAPGIFGISLDHGGYEYTNSLIHEKSPYLLQHAHNPVEWYPWGEAAFEKARKEDKPIFLSIGYSTCHWCHVMEKESFSNPDIAAIMSKYFISIKVDREERPDIDRIYMTAASSAGWGTGWPLSVWMTPDLQPFYGGTYFPPDKRWGRPGFTDILEFIANKWKEDRERITALGEQLTQHLRDNTIVERQMETPDQVALENGFTEYKRSYDSFLGGFGNAPKFPMPVNHNFLLRYYFRSGNEEALRMSLHTLREMARGGIYDHIGGGFHRYSTDARWHVPHFEKMLYDNAQIVINYLDAYQITKDEDFARIARETLNYILRDMTHSQGGFFSAEDADSLQPDPAGCVPEEAHEEKSEGAFYLWEKQEILMILGEESGGIFSYRYGIHPEGNAESDPHGEFRNKNILYVAHTVAEIAEKFSRSEREVISILEEGRQKLFGIRERRPRPGLDDKILVSWNGLMISAFARANQVLDDPAYLRAAEKAAEFIKSRMYDAGIRRLFRRWIAEEVKVYGTASDYAFLIQGIIDLYEASFDTRWLDWAIELNTQQLDLFYDQKAGGLYMTAADHDSNALLRLKEDSDNVEPSASSVATLNFLRLSQFTHREDLLAAAKKTLALFASQMRQLPRSLPQMMVALDYYLSKTQQIIIVGDPGKNDTHEMLRAIHGRFTPNKILIVIDSAKTQEVFSGYLPFVREFTSMDGKATAYICVDYACRLPTSDVQAVGEILGGD